MEKSTVDKTIFEVHDKQRGMRLDRFLKERIPRLSRRKISEAIRTRVLLNGEKPRKGAASVFPGDRVEMFFKHVEEEDFLLVPKILFEDEHFIVVDKPSRIVVHPTSANPKVNLVNLLREAGRRDPLLVVHRLDKETSGALLLAKSKEGAREASRLFAARGIVKTYWAVVHGCPSEEKFTLSLPIGRSSKGKVSIKMEAGRGGAPARTRIRILESFDRFSLLEAIPETGRQHQIRVHLAASGHPLVGDKLYVEEGIYLRHLSDGVTRGDREKLITDRHLLHSRALRFRHPFGGEEIEVKAPLPADFRSFLEEGGLAFREDFEAPHPHRDTPFGFRPDDVE